MRLVAPFTCAGCAASTVTSTDLNAGVFEAGRWSSAPARWPRDSTSARCRPGCRTPAPGCPASRRPRCAPSRADRRCRPSRSMSCAVHQDHVAPVLAAIDVLLLVNHRVELALRSHRHQPQLRRRRRAAAAAAWARELGLARRRRKARRVENAAGDVELLLASDRWRRAARSRE